jgi:hypothetical protein
MGTDGALMGQPPQTAQGETNGWIPSVFSWQELPRPVKGQANGVALYKPQNRTSAKAGKTCRSRRKYLLLTDQIKASALLLLSTI